MENKSILLIEDDVTLQNELKEYLSIYFKNVITTENGKDGYDLYLLKKPDAIFTDINLPKLNGLKLIEMIRKEDSKIPIVVLSAHTNNEYLFQAIELHLITYLIKPIATDKLQKSIKKVLLQIDNNTMVALNNNFMWNTREEKLFYATQEIELSSYEKSFIRCLYEHANTCVPYIELHIAINPEGDYSKDSLTSLVKRLRKKTSKDFIESVYMEGYRLTVLL